MSGSATIIGGLLVLLVASLPYWLPNRVLRVRGWLFTRINGEEGIAVPGPTIPSERFRALYEHPAACGRSAGAPLSDLFWYWLSPGAALHQEHLEPGPRYEAFAAATRGFLATPRAAAEQLAANCARTILREALPGNAAAVRLRDLMMPIWASFYYELVFAEPCPDIARDLIVANADDVVTALKGSRLRHMKRRDRLTAFLRHKLATARTSHSLPGGLSLDEQAWYLQGVFFNTAVVQMSEGMTHLFLALAQHGEVQEQVHGRLDDPRSLDRAIAETLRMFPLFGIAHRITADEIRVDDAMTLPKGSVLCFNYADYQRSGFADPDRFDPDRWLSLVARDVSYIPFGITANRPCPAQAIALVTMRAVAQVVLERFACHSSAAHTRSIPNRGPCLLVERSGNFPVWRRRLALLVMRVRDRWEDVWRSLAQLVFGTIMVLDARRQSLCVRHFENAGCPVHRTAHQ